jgi:hypothetical protein
MSLKRTTAALIDQDPLLLAIVNVTTYVAIMGQLKFFNRIIDGWM